MLRRTVARTLNAMGYEVQRMRHVDEIRPPRDDETWTDLSRHLEAAASIPGMVTDESCKMLYALCFQQSVAGDVAEIGSWQGKSTAFLAQAVKDSANGRFHAVDHFQGNVDKEAHYVVGREDLSDLESNFRRNMEMLGLADVVHLHNKPSGGAAKDFADRSLRFLFIDGDHTYAGVTADLAAYWRKLKPGAIVVFDDYSQKFPGVVDAVRQLVRGTKGVRAFAYWNTVVVTLPGKGLPRRPPVAPA